MTTATNPLKIGFVLDDGLDKPDGVQQNILTLGTWLASQGHQVRYIVGETTRTDLPSVITLSKNLKVSFNGNRLSVPLYSSAKKIKITLKSEQFDVLHVQVPYSPLMAGRLISRLETRTALVGTYHILPTGPASFWGAKLLGLWLSLNLKRFDRQLAVSEPAKLFARRSFKLDCEILPNPVELAKYRPIKPLKKSDGKLRLLFVGRLVERKGCRYLLQAIDYMLANNPPSVPFHLDICGDGPLKSQLENYVISHQLQNYVNFHGFISEDQKIDFMQRADISVFPSTGGESFGIVLVEAMAGGGGIVLGGDNPGYSSVLSSLPGSLVEPDKTVEFSSVLNNFMRSKPDRNDLYKNQQQLVKQFDVNVVGQKLLKIYYDCISQKNIR